MVFGKHGKKPSDLGVGWRQGMGDWNLGQIENAVAE